jgi:uncharacterized protein DUF4058
MLTTGGGSVVEREEASGDDRRSPFPGMDPYLEDPGGWAGVHGGLISIIRAELNRLLGPGFVADASATVYVVPTDERHWIFPEVVMEMVHQPHVIIRDCANREVMTMIEILSPINKAPADSRARVEFLSKRADVVESGAHWVEIDLLRVGECPPEAQGISDYHALVKRAGSAFTEVWTIGVRDRLPTIAIPLGDAAADVPLDLQAALDRLYSQGRYADLIDYAAPPPPPSFPLCDQQWVAARLAGRRAERP